MEKTIIQIISFKATEGSPIQFCGSTTGVAIEQFVLKYSCNEVFEQSDKTFDIPVAKALWIIITQAQLRERTA